MNDNYSVYVHIFPDGKKYIGVTSQKPKYRWRKGEKYFCNQYMKENILKYGWENVEHIVLFENLSKEQAEQKEIELIHKYKTNIREYGHNISLGGITNQIVSEETRLKISVSRKGKFTGKKPMLGKKHSLETRKKMSEVRKGKKRSAEAIRKTAEKNSIKVIQCELNGTFIKKWNSISEASRALKIKDSDISRVCKGKRNKAGGFKWYYLKNYNIDDVIEGQMSIYDLEGVEENEV